MPDSADLDPTWSAPFESGRPILIVPGLFNSEPEHWQSHWERTLPGVERVDQADWERPTLGDWTASLAEAVRQRPGAILVAHSLGCALVAHYANISGGRHIGGALLVAPADVYKRTRAGRLLSGFSPLPQSALPFPSTVVASRNDPYVAFERAARFALKWEARFVDLGLAGHINVASGHTAWPEGLSLLRDLGDRCAEAVSVPVVGALQRRASGR